MYLRAHILAIVLFGVTSASVASSAIRVRVENRTGFDLTQIKVVFADGSANEHSYGALKQRASSPYYSPDAAYRWAYVEAVARQKKLVCQPYDSVGAPLSPGAYTYVLTYQRDAEPPYQLSIELRRDS